MERFSSQDQSDYARRLLAMMRGRFGGHAVPSPKGDPSSPKGDRSGF